VQYAMMRASREATERGEKYHVVRFVCHPLLSQSVDLAPPSTSSGFVVCR
jgi:hypothetical protein